MQLRSILLTVVVLIGSAILVGAAATAAPAAAPILAGGTNVQTSTFALDAKRLHTDGQLENVSLDPATGTIVLNDWCLIENDADGAGYPYAQEILGGSTASSPPSGDTRIRKELVLDSASVREARLLIFHCAEVLWETVPYEASVQLTINGHEQQARLHGGWNRP